MLSNISSALKKLWLCDKAWINILGGEQILLDTSIIASPFGENAWCCIGSGISALNLEDNC